MAVIVTTDRHAMNAIDHTGQPFDFRERLTHLHEPHMAPLTDYVRRLKLTERGFVPFFDPLDGGVNASVLFLMEKAGPTAPVIPIVSFDADNAAAVHARQALTKARIPREWTVVWNLMPWWDGQRKYTAADRLAGLSELPNLFRLLPKLRVVVLVGAQAAKAKATIQALGYAVITSAHTSMLCRNSNPELFHAIPVQWAKVHRFVGAHEKRGLPRGGKRRPRCGHGSSARSGATAQRDE